MNKNLLKWTVFATTALGFGVGMAAPAMAQSGDSVDAADIVVTARRTEERLQDVPISITVFNQEQLSEQNIVNAGDLASVTPSLSANSFFGAGNTSFAIRGFVQEIGTAPSVGTYFNDVVALRAAAQTLNVGEGAGPGQFFDLQNVQVLKGPQGTLFGRNTTGGSVLLVPQRPTDEFGGYLQGSIGDYDMRGVQAVLNLPISDDVRLRLGMDRSEREGYLNNTSGIGPDHFNDVNYEAYRASLVIDLATNLENYTVASYSRSATNGGLTKLYDANGYTPGGTVADCGPAPIQGVNTDGFAFTQYYACAQLYRQDAQGDGFYDVQNLLPNPEVVSEQWQVINTTTWDISDSLTFKNIMSYGELTSDYQTEIFGLNFVAPNLLLGGASSNYNYALAYPIASGHTAAQSTFTNEMRLEGRSFEDRLAWQAGFYVEDSSPLGNSGSQAAIRSSCVDYGDPSTCTGSTVPDFVPDPDTQTDSVYNVNFSQTKLSSRGLYAQGTYSLTDQLKLTVGYRYTWDDASMRTTQYAQVFSAGVAGPVTAFCSNPNNDALSYPTGCESSYNVHSDAPTWLLGLDYSPTEDLLLYAKYSRGYRTGSIAPTLFPPFNTTEPERVDTYEIGQKWSFHGPMPGILNTSLFYNDFSNQQLGLGILENNGSGVQDTAAPFNIGSSEMYGLELDASIRPFAGLTLSANYTYLHTEIMAVNLPTIDPATSPFILVSSLRPGDQLSLSPENKYTLGAEYVLPLSESIGQISLGATFIHTDEMVSNYSVRDSSGEFAGASILDATDLLNLNIRWESIGGSPVDLLLFGTNVTDEEYFAYKAGTSSQFGGETGAVGAPSMYGARLTYRFGGAAN